VEPPADVQQWDGTDYTVRPVTGQAANKTYRCPGCQQLIRPGQPHLVTWPADDPEASDRRHWHRVCWEARHRRRPR
jgi:hypothetical protein